MYHFDIKLIIPVISLYRLIILRYDVVKEAIIVESMKTMRQAKGLSVDELAEKTGMSKNMIWSYESGRREPTASACVLIADALDCSLDMLIRGKEKDRPEERSKEGLMKLFDSMSLPELRLAQALVSMTIAYKELQLAPGSDGQ